MEAKPTPYRRRCKGAWSQRSLAVVPRRSCLGSIAVGQRRLVESWVCAQESRLGQGQAFVMNSRAQWRGRRKKARHDVNRYRAPASPVYEQTCRPKCRRSGLRCQTYRDGGSPTSKRRLSGRPGWGSRVTERVADVSGCHAPVRRWRGRVSTDEVALRADHIVDEGGDRFREVVVRPVPGVRQRREGRKGERVADADLSVSADSRVCVVDRREWVA